MVSAREIYEKLGIKTRFDLWIKRRLKKYGFVENVDFIAYVQNRTHASGREYSEVDYILKLDVAKEISMVENNEMGRKIRQYFIQCEEDLALALEDRLQKLEIENKMNNDKFSKKEMNHMFEAMFSIIKLADELHTDIAKVDDLLGSIHKREEYIAMFSDNVKYFAKDKFDGEIYKGNKICKIKPRSDKND